MGGEHAPESTLCTAPQPKVGHAMKVFAGKNIFSEYNPDLLIYLDTDIMVMHDFQVVEEALQEKDILITPHATTTFPDNDFLPRERDFNRSGIYNAGFLALKNTKNTLHFLDWWASHMQTECYLDFAEGMGADQVWMNLIPILFEKVCVFLHPGANVAYWNLHERELSIVENKVYVNESWPLLFLHISGYDFSKPLNLSRHQNRFNLIDMPLLKSLLDQYRELVVKNGYETFSKYKCAYGRKKKKKIGLMRTLNKWLKPFKISITKI